ncbi:coiled-coil domain-containing protein 57 isoform X2 [Perca fluviatilis]|uniref:coiled-coil domain-containing protein 57 isoform X2 n=1 Tax=Perca fluviatilis TaxID=8168 RepID=UPI0019634E68|nr:coiled-coil domain-containing protein 57 isoform X2 [Perca fluviatilis]
MSPSFCRYPLSATKANFKATVLCSTMLSDGDSGLGDLETQLAARVHKLESSLKKAQEEYSSLRECYQQLREDFQFNLAVLDERDRELERYDVITARTLTVEHNRQGELNQLHMQVDRLEKQRARETEKRQEELSKNQHNAAHHRRQLDELKRSMAGEIQKQKEEYERMKWDLHCRIQELEGEITLQRQIPINPLTSVHHHLPHPPHPTHSSLPCSLQMALMQEMTAAFDSELRQREHEFNLKLDEVHAVVLSYDIKVVLLSKEIEVHSQAQHQNTEALKASNEFCQRIQTQLQHKELEIKDLTAVKDYKLKELEDELKCIKTTLKKEEDDHIKKYEGVARALKECDAQLEAQCQTHIEQLQKAEKRIVKLHGNVKVLAAQVCCIQKNHQEALKKKDETIQRYKEQLSAGLKRERALEQMQVQVELECQKRCEDMKAQHYFANEQLIQDLTQARDQAKAELKEKEQGLQDLTVLLRSVKTERDQALQGLTPKVDSLASEEIHCLQQQNSILRAVVTQMRKEMEDLIHLLPHSQTQLHASSPQPVQHPEAPPTTSVTPTANTQMATGPAAQSTDISSNISPAGGLCRGKRAITSVLAKQESRGAESALANLKEQGALVRQLQEENLYLRRQQASGFISGGLFKVWGAKSNPPFLHTRLKQAASCIARLSREKQQLIEMGNRLRAQITTAGIQAVEPERDTSMEKQEDQHDRLFALEQLQYQLTTQELQYALRQRACTLAETTNRCPATEGAANPWSQGHKPTDRPESSKNKENTISQSQSSIDVRLQPHSGLSRSRLSSEESLWEILDHGFSPSIISEGEGELSRREVTESSGDGVQMMLHGIGAIFHSQPPTEVQQRRNPSKTPSNTTKTSRPGSTGRICKIRNYNVKD